MVVIVCYRHVKEPGYVDVDDPPTVPVLIKEITASIDGEDDITVTVDYSEG